MFIVSLTYLVPLEEVDKFLALHVSYLEEQYAFGDPRVYTDHDSSRV